MLKGGGMKMKYWFIGGLSAGIMSGAVTTDLITSVTMGAVFVALLLAARMIDSLLYTTPELTT